MLVDFLLTVILQHPWDFLLLFSVVTFIDSSAGLPFVISNRQEANLEH